MVTSTATQFSSSNRNYRISKKTKPLCVLHPILYGFCKRTEHFHDCSHKFVFVRYSNVRNEHGWSLPFRRFVAPVKLIFSAACPRMSRPNSFSKTKFSEQTFFFWRKTLRATSPDVIVQLFKGKCLPALYYGSEACPVNKTVTKSLQYVIKSCFSKIFQTRSDDVIAECMDMFKCLPVTDEVSRRKRHFCYGSASVITFYVISAVLLHQLSSD